MCNTVSNKGSRCDNQASLLGLFLEALVVTGVATAGILDALRMAPIVNHLMHQSSDNIRNRAMERLITEIDLLQLETAVIPRIIRSKMTMSTGSTLNGNCRS